MKPTRRGTYVPVPIRTPQYQESWRQVRSKFSFEKSLIRTLNPRMRLVAERSIHHMTSAWSIYSKDVHHRIGHRTLLKVLFLRTLNSCTMKRTLSVPTRLEARILSTTTSYLRWVGRSPSAVLSGLSNRDDMIQIWRRGKEIRRTALWIVRIKGWEKNNGFKRLNWRWSTNGFISHLCWNSISPVNFAVPWPSSPRRQRGHETTIRLLQRAQ